MLRSTKELLGYKIKAKDGELGHIVNFYFDDGEWSLRYLVVDTGHWLPGKKRLLSPAAFYGKPEWENKTFPVVLSKELVEQAPDIDTQKPISLQMEEQIHSHYSWNYYWPGNPEDRPDPLIRPVGIKEEEQEKLIQKTHLRSLNEVLTYHLESEGHVIGKVEDFILDDQDWSFRYIVFSLNKWLAGEKVLVSPNWIEEVSWHKATFYSNMSEEFIQNCPVYREGEPINRDFEQKLYDYHGKPVYWKKDS